ncbi:uncharacterized protein BX663DRAFT_537037 [Cokeromyces recurvatus]|uniref:uncharacterized protein n=1 Tax=Cokeromyces recurvatus TaxID=90255 RepID=UPI00221FF0C7|nr:uncharacterized protein BX663DRAFT_537037 [Cokeromyces recurvatus]KAI7901732.1 hypothetical protein BX663DRAFT_537037 [Cokeromyces recurvatus]
MSSSSTATSTDNDNNNSNSSNSPDSSMQSSPVLSSSTTEDVTTIFVVGFPDDMQEREFQNMFIFSKGFEAASLKWHCKEQTDDQELFYNPFNNFNNKKQMIGFAKFHTRQEAIDAANEMNGRKVDIEKGSILKAEMAKKNLHIKHNSTTSSTNANISSNNLLFLPDQTTTTTSPPITTHFLRRFSQPQIQQPDILSSFPKTDTSTYLKSFSPLPSDLLSPGDYENDPFLSDPLLTEPNTPSFNESLFGSRSQPFDIQSNRNTTIATQSNHNNTVHPYSLFSASSRSPETLDATSSLGYLSKSTPAFYNNYDFAFPSLNNGLLNGDEFSLLGRKNSLQPSSNTNSILPTSLFRNNSADQNPPCNTLYVGNLPPTTSEDELRSLFSSCEGYKRMCFRQKPQGPMCFVEFEDIAYATQAINQHQGHILSNSIKGGIRLSFSKNPLFIKPNKENMAVTSNAFNFKQMGTALLTEQ